GRRSFQMEQRIRRNRRGGSSSHFCLASVVVVEVKWWTHKKMNAQTALSAAEQLVHRPDEKALSIRHSASQLNEAGDTTIANRNLEWEEQVENVPRGTNSNTVIRPNAECRMPNAS